MPLTRTNRTPDRPLIGRVPDFSGYCGWTVTARTEPGCTHINARLQLGPDQLCGIDIGPAVEDALLAKHEPADRITEIRRRGPNTSANAGQSGHESGPMCSERQRAVSHERASLRGWRSSTRSSMAHLIRR